MADKNQTQKEVGKKYRDNLRYFKRPSFVSRVKFYLSVLFVLLGVYGIMRLESSHWDKIYNPAPLSVSHAFLEGNCAACHTASARDVFHHDWSSGRPSFFTGSASINQSCVACHVGLDLHQPTSETLALKDFHSELHIAEATGCFSCHQEHLGRVDLKLPGDTACAACHNSLSQMAASFMRVSLTGTTSKMAFDGVTSDGVVHFIPPERKAPLPLFATFEGGHPPFEYEQPGLKNPDVLKFSHRLHLTPALKLACADCHKPSADGIYYQGITYEAACQRCHMLQIDPSHPELVIPHGSVARLQAFLHSLTYQYLVMDQKDEAARHQPPSPDNEKAFAMQQVSALIQRAHVQSPGELENEILFTANPYKDAPPTTQRPFFAGCAYCHNVTQPAAGGDAVITPPQFATRWLAHGAFTHAKHTFMDCAQCHNAAGSTDATQIMMPAQASCVTCHKTNGTAPSNCLACHTFHSPQSVVKTIKAQYTLPPLAGCPAMGPLSGFLVSQQRPGK